LINSRIIIIDILQLDRFSLNCFVVNLRSEFVRGLISWINLGTIFGSVNLLSVNNGFFCVFKIHLRAKRSRKCRSKVFIKTNLKIFESVKKVFE
jgi:hypothetical protein